MRPVKASWVLVVCFGAVLQTAPAIAFKVDTALTDGCHETMSLTAFDAATPLVAPAGISVFATKQQLRLARSIVETYGYTGLTADQQIALFSLILGVRHPDSGGHSLLNLYLVRELHDADGPQHDHALRRRGDDGPTGAVLAMLHATDRIRQRVIEARNLLSKPIAEQVESYRTFVESYGEVEVPIWLPAFNLGLAFHTTQDGFSHTVRSPDLKTVYEVLNYIEVAKGGFSHPRDGLKHSNAMDRCGSDEPHYPAVLAAIEASQQLQTLTVADLASEAQFNQAFEGWRSEWFTVEQSCVNPDTAYCGSPWLEPALRSPTLSCSAGQEFHLPIPLLIALLLVVRYRRKRAHR